MMNPQQYKALKALLENQTQRAAAEAAGINERTLRRYLDDPEFQAEYKKALNNLVSDVSVSVKKALAPALATLCEISSDPNKKDADRIRASANIFEYGLRLVELTDIIQTLEAAEE